MDFVHVFKSEFHFDREEFARGREIITDGLKAVKASSKQNNFETARRKLGQILHPLQVLLLLYYLKSITELVLALLKDKKKLN